jgi:pSer/pThr/pTyr-binding forkhead associated (FHA) protein
VANTLFCSECGTYLLEDDRRGTDPLGTDEIGWVGEDEEDAEASPLDKGTGPLSVRLRILDSGREIEATLSKAIHMGRLDPASVVFPEIYLTNDNGLEKGVSRRHARILKREGTVVVEDLGSINGTFINSKRLAPYLPEVLHHGDQLQLVKLLIEVEMNE